MKKSVKKALSVLLCAALLFGAAPLNGFVGLHFPQLNLPKLSSLFSSVVHAADPTSGTCGTNLTWEYDTSTATLTISGTGAMSGYSYSNSVTTAPWKMYYQTMQTVVINSGVTSIGSYAFYDCIELTSVTIGNSVASIGEHAFTFCISLMSVTIPDSVTSIGDWAFSSCYGLTSMTIPDRVTSIGRGAFDGCTGLTSVNIGNSVTSIGTYAFSDCTGLTSVTIPNSVTSIDSGAFYRCYGLTSVTIPSSVKSIGSSAFCDCPRLTSVTIGNSVTSIGGWAFGYCTGLTSVYIPDSVTSIGEGAFDGCSYLKDVYYSGSESDRAKISISSNNSGLTSATWHYNCILADAGDTVASDGSIVSITNKQQYTRVGGTKITAALDGTADLYEALCVSKTLTKATAKNSDFVWTSGDEAILKVTGSSFSSFSDADDGKFCLNVDVLGVAPGSTTLTVTTSDGASSTCTVTVAEKPIYTLTYKDGDKVLAVQQYHAGDEIEEAALDFLPYTFYNWNPELPDSMPDHDLVVTAEKSAFARSKDGFSFTNIAKNFINYSTNEKRKYHVSSEAYLNMKDSLSMAFIDWIRWNGSCHGMSAMVSSFFSNRINSSSFGAETAGQLKRPIENIPLRDAINVLQIAQELSPQFYACKIGGQLQSQESNLKRIVELAQSINAPGDFLPVIAINIENLEGYSNHAVTICGIDPLLSSDTYHAIHIYDPNLETERTMKIARDYSWCQLLGLDTKIWWVVDDPNLLDINTFLKTPIKNKKAVAAKNNESADEYTLIIAKTSGLIQITNQNGQIAQIQNHEIIRDEIGIAGVFPLSDNDEFSQIGISNKRIENQKLTVTDLNSDNLTMIVLCTNSSMAADLFGNNYSVVFDSEGKVSVISDQKVSGRIGCSSLDVINGTDYHTVEISGEELQSGEVSFINGNVEIKNVDTDEAEIKLEGVNENGFVSASNTDGDLTFAEADGATLVSPKIVYTLSYNANGGTGAPASQNGSGSIALSKTSPTRDGYTFKGWATSTTAATAQYQPGESFNLTSNVTLYAVWQKNETPPTKPMVKSVSINDLTLNFKSALKLNPTVTADDGAEYTVTYVSSDPNVAKVDASGNVTGMKRGTATVTVTVTDSYGNTASDTCKVTVKYTVLQWIIKILLFGWIWYK